LLSANGSVFIRQSSIFNRQWSSFFNLQSSILAPSIDTLVPAAYLYPRIRFAHFWEAGENPALPRNCKRGTCRRSLGVAREGRRADRGLHRKTNPVQP
jgi:hypothetical protein